MTDFKYKTCRCEWQIVNQPVGQYGEDTGLATILAIWPTYEDALADRPYHGHEEQYVKGRWVPNVSNGYEILEIRYREVEV